MADSGIPALPSATTLAGSEELHVVQGGNSRKTTTGSFYIPGGTDVAVTDGGTGASDASGARTNLGLVIGTDVQAYNAGLADIAGLDKTDGNIIVGNGTNWVAESGDTARASLGVAIGTDVQAYNSNLAEISALTTTAYGRSFLTYADEAAFKAAVNLEIGVDVQGHSSLLDSVSSLALLAGDVIYATGANAVAKLGIGTEGQVLRVSALGIPEWGTAAGLGDMLESVYDPQAIGADAFARSNHTGTQAISTVTGLQTALDGKQAQSANLDAWSALATPAKQDADANLTTLSSGTTTLGAMGLSLLGTATADDAVTALNVKALNADGGFTASATQGTQTAAHEPNGGLFNSLGTPNSYHLAIPGAVTGPRFTMALTAETMGGNPNGPGSTTSPLWLHVKKTDYMNNLANGEIDGLYIGVIQGAVGDVGGILVGVKKKIGDGTIDEGSITSMEISTSRFSTDDTVSDIHAQQVIGFSFNPVSAGLDRGISSYWAEARAGANHAAFHGVYSYQSAGSFRYLLLGERARDTDPYWKLTFDGGLEATNYGTGAGEGPVWVLNRSSTSPAANDVMASVYFRGKNSASEDANYAWLYAAINDPTDGSEDGLLRFHTMIGGSLLPQVSIANGVAIGNTAATMGQNTLNVQSNFLINGTVRIDADGAARPPSYTGTQLSTATDPVNTTRKVTGKQVWHSNNGRVVYASGPNPTDPWVLADGTVALTPA